MPPPHSLHCTEPTGKCKKKSDTNEGLSSREYRDSAAPNGPTREILRESYKENAERRAPQQPCTKNGGCGDYPFHTRVAQREPPEPRGELSDKESRSENVRTGEKDPKHDSAIGEGRPEDPPADATG
jgi:hypothetical protein